MNDIEQSRTASILSLVVGLWVAVSPIFISVSGWLLASVIITGLAIAAVSLVQYFWENTIPSWITSIVAVWLFISAFLFAGISVMAMWNLIISAIVVFALAIWDEVEISHFVQENRQSQER